VTSECVRMVSAALQSKAITLDPAAVDRCTTDFDRALQGCAWIGLWPPQAPKSCLHLLEGTLDKGAKCRSALECKKGLRSAGAGAGGVKPGRCAEPAPNGLPCGGRIDPLADYAVQLEAEIDHPVCAGFCDRTNCASAVEEGGACQNNFQCGRGRHCSNGKCAK